MFIFINLTTAIEIFCSYIQDVHTKSLETMRQTLIKQYVQLLIKCVCKGNYPPITTPNDDEHHHHHHLHLCRNSQSLFIPRDADQEILLLLLLGQTSTLNEAVLDWQPEYEARRENESYEQVVRFSFEHCQTWYNYGLSLILSGQPFRGYLILKECLRMQPQNTQLPSLFEIFPSNGEADQLLLKQTSNQQQNNLSDDEQQRNK